MSTTLFALALFGCSDDGSACQRLHMASGNYTSQTDCAAKLDEAMSSDTAKKADYPTVYAQCMTIGKLATIGYRTVDLNRYGVRFAALD